MATLRDWLIAKGLQDVLAFSAAELAQSWDPSPDDNAAAASLFQEMQNRIITQYLPYRSGIEKTALESVYFFFKFTRKLSEDHNGKCPCFDFLADRFLERTVRSFTASWHRTSEDGGFKKADTCRLFRRELLALQTRVRPIHQLLAALGNKTYVEPVVVKRDLVGSPLAPGMLQGVDNSDLLDKEKNEIVTRRSEVLKDQTAEPANLVGLAISGGGIRSATFATGVIQGLAEKGYLTAVDYLSTVSGGGYIGSFLSSYLNSSLPDVGLQADKLPFKKVENNEAPPIRHMRNHSKYLAEGGLLAHLHTGAQVAYGVLTNLLTVLPFIVLASTASFALQHDKIKAALDGPYRLDLNPVTSGALALLAVLVIGLAVVQNLGRIGPRLSRFCRGYQSASTVCLLVALILVFYDLQPAVFSAYHWLVGKFPTWSHMGLALLSPPQIGALVVFLKRYPAWSKVAMSLFWFSGPLAFLVFYFAMTRELVMIWSHQPPELCWCEILIDPLGLGPFPLWYFLAADLVVIAYCFTLINVNTTSPHTFYRDQVASAYLLKPVQATGGAVQVTINTEPNAGQILSDLNQSKKGPYHLLNGALNLSASSRSDLRGRESDFFLFSKHFCGSPILGYFPTKHWESLDAHLNLATAMAISGAAAAPIMGMASIFGASFMLALLNVRLAYWMRVPKHGEPSKTDKALAWIKGPGPLYVLREMAGWTKETTRFVNVSDGGHLENLGVYELLRRKCKFIIAVDGECDDKMVFPSLLRVIRFAKIDFGIDIDLDLNDLRLDEQGFSKAHSAFGIIHYGNGQSGLLLYIKSSMTGNEPDYAKAYKAKEPAFPHESTAKQLFAEDQFEAYRALGHHAVADLFQPELMVTPLAPNAPLSEWFQRLANSLIPE